jgi:hypothetical protein
VFSALRPVPEVTHLNKASDYHEDYPLFFLLLPEFDMQPFPYRYSCPLQRVQGN